MFDGVFNHISSKSYWFQEFLNGNPEYADFFIHFSEKRKISQKKIGMLMRPRTTDVLTPYYTYHGKNMVWTTFSPDQVDLKFQNPRVLLRITELMLYYVRRGADLLRLDAVTYLWSELGTVGAHLWQTHTIIRLFREILDEVAPHVALITETNVPHKDNISYFGNGSDQAQMVYNFALPPLVLHTIQTGNAKKLTDWARTLENPSRTATFFNFLDSHDGIGLLGARGILSDEEIQDMVNRVLEYGGLISYRIDEMGNESPYELNITSYSAMNREDSDEPVELQVQRYLAARSIPLVIIGVPGVYLHGLLGSANDIDAVKNGREKRSINRHIISRKELIKTLEDENTTTYMVSFNLSRLINKRIQEKAFHPHADQKVLELSNNIFSVLRTSLDGRDHIIAITNVMNRKQAITINTEKLGIKTKVWFDLLSKMEFPCRDCEITLHLGPYQICWLKAQ
jgi:sucrose phosphorylase